MLVFKSVGFWIAIGVFGCFCLVLGLVLGSTMTTANDNSVTPSQQQLLQLSDAFAEIAAKVNPSVVNITATEPDSETAEDDADEDTPDGGQPQEQQKDPFHRHEYGFGSGVIIESNGYVLTSNHVIESATKIEVKLSDDEKFVAKVIGQDKETDLALIKVESKHPLPTASMGDSDRLRPGQWVMAIGNPFVYDHTVTTGVISALNRKLGTTIFDNFIQTDAAINFGNSGGPLVNISGEVIGINTMISAEGTGIGFATPINTAKEIIPQLKQTGKVSRGFLGLVPQEISEELQQSLGLQSTEGVIVSSIQKDTPADKAGLKRYDVILEINGQPIKTEDQFRKLIADAHPGDKVTLKVLRDSKPLTIVSELSERKLSESPISPLETEHDKVGMKLTDLTPQLRKHMGLPDDVEGVVVSSVDPGKSADDAGLSPGDIIVEVNKQPVGKAADVEKQIRDSKPGEPLLLYVLQDGQYTFLTLTVQ